MRHIIPISGKDSLATALVQRARQPDLPYEYMYNPTGFELPEVEEWLIKVEQYLGQPIVRVGKDLAQVIAVRGYYLPSRQSRYCTKEAKLAPTEVFIGKDPAMVYYGLRADELDRVGYNNSGKKHITPVFPLREIGIDLQAVYAINHAAGLKPPTFFWQSLYEMVLRLVSEDFIKSRLTEWAFDALFSWRSRANCDRCFNQRLYEWVGLLEHHPARFWEAESWEHMGSEHTWNNNLVSLQQIADRAESIKQKRVRAIVKLLNYGQNSLFDQAGFIDILSITSCGLLCGK